MAICVEHSSGSTSTEENARFAAEAAPHIRRVLVVSDAFHIFRVERVFGRYFDEVTGVGSVGHLGSRIKGALREVVAVTAYGALGRL
ncbi:MAG: ElyC/SanA/YdcF family protein [Myxococcota bacterium]